MVINHLLTAMILQVGFLALVFSWLIWQDGIELLLAELARLPEALKPKAAQMLVPERAKGGEVGGCPPVVSCIRP